MTEMYKTGSDLNSDQHDQTLCILDRPYSTAVQNAIQQNPPNLALHRPWAGDAYFACTKWERIPSCLALRPYTAKREGWIGLTKDRWDVFAREIFGLALILVRL